LAIFCICSCKASDILRAKLQITCRNNGNWSKRRALTHNKSASAEKCRFSFVRRYLYNTYSIILALRVSEGKYETDQTFFNISGLRLPMQPFLIWEKKCCITFSSGS
jgi:hypothetical protein